MSDWLYTTGVGGKGEKQRDKKKHGGRGVRSCQKKHRIFEGNFFFQHTNTKQRCLGYKIPFFMKRDLYFRILRVDFTHSQNEMKEIQIKRMMETK